MTTITHQCWARAIGAVIFLLFSLLAVAPGTAADSGEVVSAAPVTLTGIVSTEIETDAHAYTTGPGSVPGSLLEAEHLKVHRSWEQGVRAGGDQGESGDEDGGLARYVTDSGEEELEFTHASVRFTDLSGIAEMLAFPDGHAPKASVLDGSRSQVASVTDRTVVHPGPTRHAQEAGQAREVGFRYDVQGPVAWHEGSEAATATVRGNFTLFVNNVTLHVTTPESRWSNWTGYQEEDPGRPVSSYEQRTTLLKVTNGTFRTSGGLRTAIFGASIAADVHGTLTSPAVTGHLTLDERSLVYEDDPLFLEGAPTITATMTPRPLEQAADPATTAGGGLTLSTTGEFRVIGTEGLTTAPSSPSDGGGWFSPPLELGTLVVLLALASVAIAASPRGRRAMRTGGRRVTDALADGVADLARRLDRATGNGEAPGAAGPVTGPHASAGRPATTATATAATATTAADLDAIPDDEQETRGVLARVVQWRSRTWMERGREANRTSNWPRAVEAYRRVTELDPSNAAAWFLRAVAELETGAYEDCLVTVDQARNCPWVERWDLLQLRAAAAWFAGQRKITEGCLNRMVEHDRRLTRRFVETLGIPTSELADELGRRIDGEPPGGRLDGYV